MKIQPELTQYPLQPSLTQPRQVEVAKPLRPNTDRMPAQRPAQPRPLLETDGRIRLLDHLSTPLHQTGEARKTQHALAAYQQVVDLEQRDYMSTLIGIDYYA